MRHESKCAHLHGHRYVVDITTAASQLDELGRVVDFSVVKRVVGAWIDDTLDHGTIVNREDFALISLCKAEGWKFYTLPENPTAETLAHHIAFVAGQLLERHAVRVVSVRVYETPNCWADYP